MVPAETELLAFETAAVLSATNLANVPGPLVLTLLLPPVLVLFFMVFFSDCIMLVYVEEFFDIFEGTDDKRLPPSFPIIPPIEEELLPEITRVVFPDPENRFLAAGGRDDMPPPPDNVLPVAAASTADAVTGLFWFEATKTFFPLPAAPDDPNKEAALPEATTAERVGASDCTLPPAAAAAAAASGMEIEGADEAEEVELEVLLLAVLCLGSICRMSTSGSLMRVAISECACLVASSDPLMVMDRSPGTLPCFSTSMWAPVAARIALMLLPARPMTLEMACTGT